MKRLSAAFILMTLTYNAASAEAVVESTPAEINTSQNEQCLLEAIGRAPPDASVSALQQLCNPTAQTQLQRNEHALRGRLALEEVSRLNPFVLTPHRRNYLLPISYWSNPVSNNPLVEDSELHRQEAKFQISLKAPLLDDFWNGYTLYFSFTSTSWWQLYNRELSRPFRETNYEPEVFMARTVDWQLGPLDSELLTFGYWHHSNGRDVPVSRSWDRLFISYVFRTGSWYGAIKPWWRIPENKGRDDEDPKRDDNPDIERYLGHFDFTVIKPMGNHVFELMLRNNLRRSENRGSAQLEYSFPINRRFKGFFQAFTGYGDSLINYNNYENRVSVGVLLTDTF